MMKSQWLTHHGKRIFLVDLSNFKLDEEGLKAEAASATAVVCKEPEKSMLMLVNLKDTLISPHVSSLLKENIDQANKYGRKGAIMGLTGTRKIMFEIFSRLTKAENASFDDMEKAKDWLVG
jgi:hypothetical protein